MRADRILIASSKSLGANYTSPAVNLEYIYGYSVQAIWTGSPVGHIALQMSLDYRPANPSLNLAEVAGTWDEIDGSSADTTGINSFSWNVNTANYPFFRVKFTWTSGSGTLTFLYAYVRGA